MSAEKRILPILAFSEETDFPVDQELRDGVRETMASYSEAVKKARLENATPDPRVSAEWERLENTAAIDELVENARVANGKIMIEPVDPPCQDS